MLKEQVGLHDIANSAFGQEKERPMCNMQKRENHSSGTIVKKSWDDGTEKSTGLNKDTDRERNGCAENLT